MNKNGRQYDTDAIKKAWEEFGKSAKSLFNIDVFKELQNVVINQSGINVDLFFKTPIQTIERLKVGTKTFVFPM